MAMFPGVTPEQMKMAMGMSLLSAGMGTLGGTGSAGQMMNRGFQQGMGTFMPMMQWMQQSAMNKEDKEYQKKRDKIRDRYLKNQESVQAVQLGMQDERLGLERRQLEMTSRNQQWQRQKYQDELDLKKQQMGAIDNLYQFATKGVPNPEYMEKLGPRAGNIGKGVPEGIPETIPLTPSQFMGLSGQAVQAGADPQALNFLGKGAFPATQPGSPYFKQSDYYIDLENRFSRGEIKTTDPEYKILLELRKGKQDNSMDAVMEMVRQLRP